MEVECLTFLWEVVSFSSHGLLEVSFLVLIRIRPQLIVGSGSTYVYGYCDATYREGWSEEETVKFVKNSTSYQSKRQTLVLIIALALAMARDGSSGGTIRMCVITKDKVERHFVPGNELPKFWEGKEIIGQAAHPVTVGA